MKTDIFPVLTPDVFFVNAVRYGILSKEDAELQLMKNIENCIKKEFKEVAGVELKVTYIESSGVYKIRVPKGIQDKYDLEKNQYYGKTAKAVLMALYTDIFGEERTRLTLREVFMNWMDSRNADPDISPITKRHDLEYFNSYLRDDPICDMELKSITAQDWDAYFKRLTAGRQMLRSSFINIKSSLNLMGDYAVLNGILKHNIIREIYPKSYKYKVSQKREKVFTKEEIVALYKYLKESDNIYDLCLALHLCLPCRIGETKALCRSDIDREARTLFVGKEIITTEDREQTMVYHTKSGLEEGNRTLYITDAAKFILDKVMAMTDKEELFLGKTGKWLLTQELNKHLKDACKALGIEYLSTHKVRAWFATEAAKNGMDEVTMMATFGWKDLDTAKAYIRKARSKSAQKDTMEQIVDFS